MNGVDAITFTGGIGENSAIMRSHVCQHLEFLDTYINESENKKVKEGIISTSKSKIKILVVPTDEELMIARETIK